MEKRNDGITIVDIFKIIKKNIVLCLIVGATITILGILYTTCIVKEKYKSTGTVIVAVKTSSETVDYNTSLKLVQTVSELFKKDIITEQVSTKLEADGYSLTSNGIKGMINTSYSSSSFLITVSAVNVDSKLTKLVVNYSMDALVKECNSNSTLINMFGNSVGIPEYAEEGIYYSPNKILYIVVSFLCAGVIALAVVFIKELLSNKFRDKDDVEATLNYSYRVIGTFSDNAKLGKENSKYVKLIDVNAKNMAPYNKLLSNIKYSSIDNPLKVIMITSSGQGELKSSISSNLALCMAYNNKKICLIDFDFIRPTVHKTFDVKKSNGLAEFFLEEIKKEELIKKTKYNVDVITVGGKDCNQTVLLESRAIKEFVNSLKEEYDYIILDVPPVSVSTDAILASNLADGVIYNIDMVNAKKRVVSSMLADLKASGINVIGLNLTKCKDKRDFYYYDYKED